MKKKTKDRVEQWKQQLDKSMNDAIKQIDERMAPFKEQAKEQTGALLRSQQEAEGYQQTIRDILNETTGKMKENSNYIAFEIMDNEPLNERSLEYLHSQTQVWQDQCQKLQLELVD